MQPTPDGKGYWLVATDGGIFSFGDAQYYGSASAMHLNRPIVGMDATPDGKGYWLVASDGGMFSYGDARYYGSASAMHLNRPIVGMDATPDGKGYWLVASDGGVFSYGDARYYGSAGAMRLNQPIVGMQPTPDGKGYWLVASDGGIFAFGDAQFYGSLGGSTLSHPLTSASIIVGGDGVTPAQIAAWDKVNVCEESGRWNVDGPVYSGGLGFSHQNWTRFNTFGYPPDAADATPDEQIRVAVAFATVYLGGPNGAPDQNGCSGGY
jgi:hypothetical protein